MYIIANNIHYLCWNRDNWHSFHNTSRTIEGLGIRYTNHLCDLCRLNPHFIPALLWFQNMNSCWPVVKSSIHEPAASYCGVTMTDYSHMFLWTLYYHNSAEVSEVQYNTILYLAHQRFAKHIELKAYLFEISENVSQIIRLKFRNDKKSWSG